MQPPGSIPVWVFVEVGHPFSEDSAPTIQPLQLQQAVWSGIVHGARGVVYFNHNFGGDCFSFHVLRDACGDTIRPAVRRINSTIHRRARLLNAPFVDGLVSVRGRMDVAVKLHRGDFHLILAHRTDGPCSCAYPVPVWQPRHGGGPGDRTACRRPRARAASATSPGQGGEVPAPRRWTRVRPVTTGCGAILYRRLARPRRRVSTGVGDFAVTITATSSDRNPATRSRRSCSPSSVSAE